MKNIHVRRLAASDSIQGIIEPDDRSWLVIIDSKGEATFWRQCLTEECEPIVPETGLREFYIDAELPGGGRLITEPTIVQEPPIPDTDILDPVNPLDFTIESTETSGLGRDRYHPDEPGFWARLNARMIVCYGKTEHEAIRALLNNAVQLAVAGALDHTGRPMPGTSKRRYQAVFPQQG